MSGWYFILDEDHNPVACDFETWAHFFEDYDRRIVAQTETLLHRISSIFLGLDHSFMAQGPPILFETMVFENTETMVELFGELWPMHESTDYCCRYATWDECLAGHNAMVAEITKREADAAIAIAKQKVLE